MKTYTITLTEPQMRVTQAALEEYFRLRMGQDMDFSEDMAMIGRDLSPDNPNHDRIFSNCMYRRDHLREIMRIFFRIAFEPTGYLERKTDDMMIAECIWDAMRFARGISRWDKPFAIGPEPVPKITVTEDKDDA